MRPYVKMSGYNILFVFVISFFAFRERVLAQDQVINLQHPNSNITFVANDINESFETTTETLEPYTVTEVYESEEILVQNISSDTEELFTKVEEVTVNNTLNNSTNNSQVNEEKCNVTSIIACSTGKENAGLPVELVNSTRLISILVTESNITDRRTTADCTLVLFYARYCPFSSMAAPHFNALSRAFPDIKLAAVDAMKFHSFNTQYGIVGVPTLMLFHNGRPAAKFNDSEYNLEAFARFITKYTGLQPHDKLFVTSADFGGPVSSVPTKETDYCLILSWGFMLVCGLYLFSKSSWWHCISEAIQNTWHEAEAQHEHGD